MTKPSIKLKIADIVNILSQDAEGEDDELSEYILAQRETLSKVIEETRHYSITPTTFDERVFENDFDNLWFMDQYQCKGAIATRFGINAASSQIMTSITGDKIKVAGEGSGATSTVKSAGYRKEDAKAIHLASFEIELLHKAIDYLVASDNHAVLVDILARVNGGSNNGCIKMQDNLPEIHTVVLYKNPPHLTAMSIDQGAGAAAPSSNISHNILVIDPSNFLFSSHLSNLNEYRTVGPARAAELATADIATEALKEASAASTSSVDESIIPRFTITTIHKTLQIYKPAGSI